MPTANARAGCNRASDRASLFAIRKGKRFKLLGTVILWVHAVAGAIWIGACACFAIAGLALGAGSAEQHNFVTNAAPKIDVLGLVAAAVLLMTGVISLIEVGVVRGF